MLIRVVLSVLITASLVESNPSSSARGDNFVLIDKNDIDPATTTTRSPIAFSPIPGLLRATSRPMTTSTSRPSPQAVTSTQAITISKVSDTSTVSSTTVASSNHIFGAIGSAAHGSISAISSGISAGVSAGVSAIALPIRVLSHPIQNLVLMSFEGYRTLLQDANRIEAAIRQRLGFSRRARISTLDPMTMHEPVTLEHRDKNTPVLGKLVLTLDDIMISGLSQFKVEQLEGYGRNLYFQHRIPNLDSVANYTIDYHLFDAIPFRVSEGHLTANVPNAHVKGSFQIFPDLRNVWFRVAQLNLTTWVDDLDLKIHPRYIINEHFAIEKSTENRIQDAIKSLMPNITEILKVTYTKAIEMKLGRN
ncbi:hypothetical protein HDE_10161 [Halotydeus destructor]|nr:hypothetical protein HDE_10161 [Halotydeus destructor]